MKKILLVVAVLVLAGLGCQKDGGGFINKVEPVPEPAPVTPIDVDKQQAKIMESEYTFPGVLPVEQIEGKKIRIITDKGDIVFELFADTAPMAVSNFVYLTGEGYYDGVSFHRREEGFVIQGGDPNGNGTGGPGYAFEDELDDDYGYERGIVAMANRGPDTNGSQFFIMLGDTPLPKAYTVFGRVLEGMDVVDEIVVGDVMSKVSIE